MRILILYEDLDLEYLDDFLKTIPLEVSLPLGPLRSTNWEFHEQMRDRVNMQVCFND